VARRPWGRVGFAAAFGAAVAAAVAILGIFASHRDGSWTQVPITDCAVFHGDALEMLRVLRAHGLGAFAKSLVSVNRTHTPLVPASSALLMFVVGNSRHAAEAVLPIFGWILFASTCYCVERLYTRATAVASTLLFATFPVVLNLSRIYLYEMPFAAFVVAGSAAILASDGFARLLPTLAFGLCAGLASLARAGGAALVVGPTLVALVIALRSPGRGRRLLNLSLATALGLATAAIWYWPNWKPLLDYIHGATYGDQAHIFAGGSSFSWENAWIYILAIVYEGPGIPMIAVAVIAFAVALAKGGAAVVRSPVMAALWAVFALDFLVLMIAAQRCGAMLFLSVLPVVAVTIVRAAAILPRLAGRAIAGPLLAILGIVNAWDCSFAFPKETGPTGIGAGPFGGAFPLWSHRSLHLDFVVFPTFPFADYRIPEILDRIQAIARPGKASVAVCTDHPFVASYGMRAEGLRRGVDWNWSQAAVVAMIPSMGEEKWLATVRKHSEGADVIVFRRTRWNEPPTRLYTRALEPLVGGENPRFVASGEPIRLGDHSEVILYIRADKR
jgi:hypothetical protein